MSDTKPKGLNEVVGDPAILSKVEFAMNLAPLWGQDDVAADRVTRHDETLRERIWALQQLVREADPLLRSGGSGQLWRARARAVLGETLRPLRAQRDQFREEAEAVIDALAEIGAFNEPTTATRLGCLEAPAVQTHDYSSDHGTRHG